MTDKTFKEYLNERGIKYVGKDQHTQDETTNYWFDVDGEEYAVSDNNGDLCLLDCDGARVEPCNDHDNVFDKLLPLYRKQKRKH